MKGKINRLFRERGFGFITAKDGKDIFFHHSALAREDFNVLKEGTSVEFDLETGPKGLWAISVTLAETNRQK